MSDRYYNALNSLKKYLKVTFNVVLVFSTIIVIFMIFFSQRSTTLPKTSFNPQDQKIAQVKINSEIINNINKLENGSNILGATIVRLTTCNLIGMACSDNPEKLSENGLVYSMSNIAQIPLSIPVASGIAVTGYTLSHAGFIPHSLAASGIGFNGLLPFMNIWRTFRDLAFFLITIGVVVVGFMLIFKIKIGGKTEVTLQNSLPKLIIAMILINFSFAIAGFLIDLMYLSILLIVSLFDSNFGTLDLSNKIVNGNFADIFTYVLRAGQGGGAGTGILGTMFGPIVDTNSFSIANTVLSFFPYSIQIVFNTIITHVFLSNIVDGFTILSGAKNIAIGGFSMIPLIGNGLGQVLLGVIMIAITMGFIAFPQFILSIMLMLGLLFVGIRILVEVFKAYISILISVMLSPIILLSEILPGNDAFMKWLKNIVANLAVFPLIILIFIFAKIIGEIPNTQGMTLWTPPFVNLSPKDINGFAAFVAVILVAGIPGYIKSMKKSFGADDSQAFGTLATFGSLIAPSLAFARPGLQFYKAMSMARINPKLANVTQNAKWQTFQRAAQGLAPEVKDGKVLFETREEREFRERAEQEAGIMKRLTEMGYSGSRPERTYVNEAGKSDGK